MKLRVFIASSAEGLEIAETLQSNLEKDAEVTVWSQDIFRPSEYILESLEKFLGAADFGIFVFSPDDLVTIRGNEHTVARDNVIFECGLFVGRLGRGRTAFIQPGQNSIRLPSDLSGVTGLTYDPHRQDRNLMAALGPPSNKLRGIFRDLVQLRLAKEDEGFPYFKQFTPVRASGLPSPGEEPIFYSSSLKYDEKVWDCSAKPLPDVLTDWFHGDLAKRIPSVGQVMKEWYDLFSGENIHLFRGKPELRLAGHPYLVKMYPFVTFAKTKLTNIPDKDDPRTYLVTLFTSFAHEIVGKDLKSTFTLERMMVTPDLAYVSGRFAFRHEAKTAAGHAQEQGVYLERQMIVAQWSTNVYLVQTGVPEEKPNTSPYHSHVDNLLRGFQLRTEPG